MSQESIANDAMSPARKHGSLREIVLQEIRYKLLRGEFTSPINEMDLAEELQCSRGTVREALAILHNEGFLKQLPNKRLQARDYTTREKEEIVFVRRLLETIVVRELALRCRHASEERKAELLNSLSECVREMKDAADILRGNKGAPPGERARFFQNDNAFHSLLAERADLVFVARALRPLQAQVFFGGFPTSVDMGYMDRIIEEHKNILQAIGAGDVEQATEIIAQHIQHGGERWIREGEGLSKESPLNGFLLASFEASSTHEHSFSIPLSPDIDASLMEDALKGSQSACLQIADLYLPFIRLLAWQRGAGENRLPGTEDDMVQHVAARLPSYRSECSLDQWVIRVAAGGYQAILTEAEERIKGYCRTRARNDQSPEAGWVMRKLRSLISQECDPTAECILTLYLHGEDPFTSLAPLVTGLGIPLPDAETLETALTMLRQAIKRKMPPLAEVWKGSAPPPYLMDDYKAWGMGPCLSLQDFAALLLHKDGATIWGNLSHIALCGVCRETLTSLSPLMNANTP